MALNRCGTIGGAPADQAESEDLVDLFARLAASSQPAGNSRRKAQQEVKGLPEHENLKEMAKAYLEMQREHWPELAKRGLLPKPTPKVIERMAAEFEARFRDGEPTTVGQLLSNPPWDDGLTPISVPPVMRVSVGEDRWVAGAQAPQEPERKPHSDRSHVQS